MKRLLCCAAILIIFCLTKTDGYCQNIYFKFKHLTVDNGLSHTDATSIAQDRNGVIWIGTYSGLNSYDGYDVKNFYNKTNYIKTAYNNRIANVFYDGNQNLWLSTEGGLIWFDLKKQSFTSVVATTANETAFLSSQVSKTIINKQGVFFVQAGGTIKTFRRKNNSTLEPFDAGLPALSSFTALAVDKIGNVWVGAPDGIRLYPSKGSNVVFFNVLSKGEPLRDIISITFSDRETAIITTATGVFELNPKSLDKYQGNSQGSGVIRDTAELIMKLGNNYTGIVEAIKDFKGNLWLGTTNGLVQLPAMGQDNDDQHVYNSVSSSEPVLTSNHINGLFVDRFKNLWVTTFGGGVNFSDLNQEPFHSLHSDPLAANNTLSGNYIRAIVEDENGNLWIGTRTDGLNYYDFRSKSYKHYKTSNSGIVSNNIRSLVKDKKGLLWIGTDVGISIIHPDGRFENLTPDPTDKNSLTGTNFFALAVDKFGNIWTGSWNNGLNQISYLSDGKYRIRRFFKREKNESLGLSSNRVSFLSSDDIRPEVLVSTDQGLDHIFLDQNGEVKYIKSYDGGSGNRLSSNFVWPLIRQGDSLIWVGTLGGGLNKIRLFSNGKFQIEHIVDKNNDQLHDVESMLMDQHGNLWMGSRQLAMYNPKMNRFAYFDIRDGLQSNSFKIGAAFRGKNGTLYFGGINGVSYFNPSELTIKKILPPVVITDLYVNGRLLSVSSDIKNNPLREAVSYASKIKLQPDQNSFTIKFASPFFSNPERCRYRYMLKGFDKDWVYVDGSNRGATYSNLRYDDYTFLVEASVEDSEWKTVPTQLYITMLPPWYSTLLARIIYILLFVVIAYVVYRYQARWFKLKRDLEIHLMEERKQEELHQMRIQFFTNISHEFRTPLTLILGPTEKMIQEEVHPAEQKHYLKLIYSNARRLLGLINELMDFRKAETGNVKLKVASADLGEFVKRIAIEFEELAKERYINYSISVPAEKVVVPFDYSVTEKILVNLLANAFKYTNDFGTVEIELLPSIQNFKPTYSNSYEIKADDATSEHVWIKVSDTGVGISSDAIESVFDRYYRITESAHEKHLGSGVGLALVKSLVLLHKGIIRLYSERDKGSEFLIGMPKNDVVYSKNEITSDRFHKIDTENLQYTMANGKDVSLEVTGDPPQVEHTQASVEVKQKILVVEDNEQMRSFLVESLKANYIVEGAKDGEDGLLKVKAFLPDLIISDLMMPKIDGIEFCKRVRQDIEISHIPFILITAKDSADTHIEGLEYGADVYFPKPFSVRLLQLTIRNIFEQRKKLKSRYSNDVFIEARELVNNSKDKEFMDELIRIIEHHMEDVELDVDMICREIGMSRTKLYNKIKGVTGQPVGEFIRVLRLKKAAKVLVSEDVSILDVMLRVGIQSQSYFTKAFKKEFGKTPSQFISEHSSKHLNSNKD